MFNDFTIEDWLDNTKWFDIKLLVDVSSPDKMKEMKNNGYSKHMKTLLTKLRIISDIVCHLDRKLGTEIFELLEEETEVLKKMAQWNPPVFDSACSTKLPLSAI